MAVFDFLVILALVDCLSVAKLITIGLVIVYCEIKISELELFLLGFKLLLII